MIDDDCFAILSMTKKKEQRWVAIIHPDTNKSICMKYQKGDVHHYHNVRIGDEYSHVTKHGLMNLLQRLGSDTEFQIEDIERAYLPFRRTESEIWDQLQRNMKEAEFFDND